MEDAELQAKLEENIKRNGQLETVLVRSLGDGLYEVINGNHRLSAFQNAGIQKVMCYVVDGLSVEKAKRLAIELNETRFKADPKKMAELMAGLLLEYSAEDLGDTMPFSKAQLESYIPDTIDWTSSPPQTLSPKTWSEQPPSLKRSSWNANPRAKTTLPEALPYRRREGNTEQVRASVLQDGHKAGKARYRGNGETPEQSAKAHWHHCQ